MISKRYDHLLRLLLIGETGVGKTCLLCRFTSDDFVESHISTIGIDFKMKMMEVEGQMVKCQIWDTAGQERFEAITKQFYRRAQGILLVFDISSRKSYEAIPRWLEHVQEFCKENVVVTMIGNKSDKHDTRQVTFIEAQTFADQNNINFFEVSAKHKNNLEKPFQDMCKEVLHVIERDGEPATDTSIQIEASTAGMGAGNQSKQTVNSEQQSTGVGAGDSNPVSQAGENWCCSVS